MNVRKEAGLIDPATNDYMELDIYIPALRFAIEFQVLNYLNYDKWTRYITGG